MNTIYLLFQTFRIFPSKVSPYLHNRLCPIPPSISSYCIDIFKYLHIRDIFYNYILNFGIQFSIHKCRRVNILKRSMACILDICLKEHPFVPILFRMCIQLLNGRIPVSYTHLDVYKRQVYRLTGVFSQDKSQGYGWHCFDMKRCRWDREMCRQLGIDPALLPELYDCHAVVGRVTGEAAGQTGLLKGTPVVAGGLDAACGTLGAGVLQAGETQEQGGQAGGMSICLEEAKADKRLILSCHVAPGKWLLQGGTVGGGGVMRWLHREMGEAFSMRELDDMAAVIPPGSEGLIFLPYMTGERSPIWDENAKGVLFGLDFSKTKAHIVRACLEGVAFSLRHNLDTAESLGVETGTLKAMGGAANSSLWTQMKADVTGKRIEVPASDTATTLGAALLAGVGVGLYRDFEEAVGRTVAIQRVYLPQKEHAAAYSKAYQTYLKMYPALKDLMKEG